MSRQQHWEHVYSTRPISDMGWTRAHLETSFRWIKEVAPHRNADIIDVGSGASTLVDDVLAEGYTSLTLVDISRAALALIRHRLEGHSDKVTYLHGDITSLHLPSEGFDVWHDRAVFHFLTDPDERQAYVAQVSRALRPGGHLILALFSPEAPPRCSGLPVQRYAPEEIEAVFRSNFDLKRHQKELHRTPRDVEQMYLYCLFRKKS